MKVLLDENLDHRLQFHLSSFEVFTVTQMGWAGLKNGELLKHIIKAKFTHFITADKNIKYQQNEKILKDANVSVVILAGKNKLSEHLLHIKEIIKTIDKEVARGFIEVNYTKQ